MVMNVGLSLRNSAQPGLLLLDINILTGTSKIIHSYYVAAFMINYNFVT